MLRLWRFEGNSKRSNIRLCLEIHDLETAPPYIALSYVWGSRSKNLPKVSVNGGHLHVTKNLLSFLKVIQRSKWRNVYFWADQISLNQQDVLERDHQVRLMGEIYSKATIVFAWLGNLDDAPVFDPQFTWKHEPKSTQPDFAPAITLFYMGTAAYWSRLWTVQELALAKEVRIWYRGYSMMAPSFWAQLSCITIHNMDFEQNESGGHDLSWYSEKVRRRAARLNADLTPKIGTLLGQGEAGRPSSLAGVLLQFCDGNCSDPRDTVFGLQALIEPSQRIAIDYSMELSELAPKVLIEVTKRLSDELVETPWSFLIDGDLSVKELGDKFEQVAKLVQSMHLHPASGKALYWAYLVLRIPKDILSLQLMWWVDSVWRLWDALWTNVRMFAAGPKHKELAEELCSFALRYKQREQPRQRAIIDTCVFASEADAFEERVNQERRMAKARLEHTQAMINEVAIRCGFVVFDRFLLHPQQWPFKEKQNRKRVARGENTPDWWTEPIVA